MLNGSEKEVEGGDIKGGGNGREGRFANNASPVSNRNGVLSARRVSAEVASLDVVGARSGRGLVALWMKPRRA